MGDWTIALSSHNVAAQAKPPHSHSDEPKIDAIPDIDKTFQDFGLLESIYEDIAAAGYEKPTPIQAACIPPALESKDLFGLAQTGTGKTAAFALPIIQRLAHRMELGALVLSPTRELAAQIAGMFNMLGKSSGVRVATIVGGVPMDRDERALRSWPNVLVATPGRLIDHITYGAGFLKEIEILVVDEADRMHDMGFIPQIRRILAALPAKRQTMMFTATLSSDVERVAKQSMHNPVRIQVGQRSAPANRARQQLFQVTEEQKTPLLLKILRECGEGRVLVFARTKRGVDKLARVVANRRFSVCRLHGDREQADRDAAMAAFRDGKHPILIATDIAARGIDVANIEHVINYDFPHHSEDYVHRIGRTARQEASGVATSFVTRADRASFRSVQRLLGDKLPELLPSPLGGPTEEAFKSSPGQEEGGKAGGGKRRRRRRFGKRKGGASTHSSAHSST